MTRVTDSQVARSLLTWSSQNREAINKLNDDISSGVKVHNPSDTDVAGTISLYKQNLSKVAGYSNSIAQVTSSLSFQDSVLNQATELMTRAKEIATQAANETKSPTNRSQMSAEVFQIRDNLANLANSKFLGKYVYSGTDQGNPAYSPNTYANPSTGEASIRYTYNSNYGSTGAGAVKTVQLTDNLSITINTPGNQVFGNAIAALDRLGRAMAGYTTNPASGTPDGTGAAYNFPADMSLQTSAIQNAINLIDNAQDNNILPEQVDLAGRQRRVETAKSLLVLTKSSSQSGLDQLQNTDMYEAATQLNLAQTALQASLTVSTRVLRMTILDYI